MKYNYTNFLAWVFVQYLSLGLFFTFSASFFFALMNALIKILSPDIPPIQNLFFRSLVMMLFLCFIFFKPGKEKAIKKPGGWLKLWMRALLGGTAMLALFYNIATIPLSIATTFMQSTPLYTIIFAAIFLKEKITTSNLTAALIGFFGVLLICDPFGVPLGFDNILMGIISGAGTALALVTLKTLKDYFSNNFIIFFFGFSMTLVGGILLLLPPMEILDNTWRSPNLKEWELILLVGIMGTLGQHFLTKAYMSAPAGILAPMDYIRIVWGIVMGTYLGDPFPNLHGFLGIGLVIFSGLFIAFPIFLKDIKRIKNAKIL
ncbi:membrane transport protein [Helicobacter mustelae]|nr:membrane transport protein [Helicobacter mustelae]